jgi:hypothetical protein
VWNHPAVDSVVGFTVDYINDSLAADLGVITLDQASIDSAAALALTPLNQWPAYLSAKWNSMRTDALNSGIDSIEVFLVDTMVSYVSSSSFQSMTDVDACVAAITEANQLLTTFNSYTWTDSTGGLAAGSLYVLRSTAEYHQAYGRVIHKAKTPLNVEEAILADCLGYGAGYASESSRQKKNGELHDEKRCTQVGVAEAGVESALAMLIPF